MKRILFIGTTNLSYEVAESIIENKSLKIAGIITGEKDFAISYSTKKVHNYNYRDLGDLNKTKNIPVFVMNKGMKDKYLDDWIKDLEFDFVLIVGWYHMIPKSWLDAYRCFGIHASLLPDYRGGAPLVWAIINGETETGVSLFLMDDGVDTGPVVSQARVSISDNEDINSLMQKIKVETKKLCLDVLPKIDSFLVVEMNKTNAGSYYPQRKPIDGRIEKDIGTTQLSRLIRAQTRPYPGAYLESFGRKLYLWKCSIPIAGALTFEIGQVLAIDDYIGIQCKDGILPIVDFSLVEDNVEIIDHETIKRKLGL